MKITAKMLHDGGVYKSGVKRFSTSWPNGAEVNKKNAIAMMNACLDLDRIAEICSSNCVYAWYLVVRGPSFSRYLGTKNPTIVGYNARQVHAFVTVLKNMKTRKPGFVPMVKQSFP